MLEPEVVVKVAVEKGAVHVQEYGVYVGPVDEHWIQALRLKA
jgi:hypothetical protein